MKLWLRHIWGPRMLCLVCHRRSKQVYVHVGLQALWHFWRRHPSKGGST